MYYDISRSSVNGTAWTGTSYGNVTDTLLYFDYEDGGTFNATVGIWYSYRGASGLGAQSFLAVSITSAL